MSRMILLSALILAFICAYLRYLVLLQTAKETPNPPFSSIFELMRKTLCPASGGTKFYAVRPAGRTYLRVKVPYRLDRENC